MTESLSLINWINLFTIQRPTVRININRIIGPIREEIKVVSHGDRFQSPSYQVCCVSNFFFFVSLAFLLAYLRFRSPPQYYQYKNNILFLRLHKALLLLERANPVLSGFGVPPRIGKLMTPSGL
ncbi:hypothetical protein LEMLEM_LOCUS24004 [Lemmus lemmus]